MALGAVFDLEHLVHRALGEGGHVFGVEAELLDFFHSVKQ